MRHDRDIRPVVTIRPRKLPAVVVSLLLSLPVVALMILRRDLAVWIGDIAWLALTMLSAVTFALAASRLFNAEPLLTISPHGIGIPRPLSGTIRWADVAKIQATTRRSTTGDIHDRLLIHFKHPQQINWRPTRLRRLLGGTPQAAIAVDVGLIWPLSADDVRKAIQDAARTYAAGAGTQSDLLSTKWTHGHRFAVMSAVVAITALPLMQYVVDVGIPRQFSEGLSLFSAGEIGAAIPYLENDARAGDRESAYALATLYLNGDGVARNTAMAAGWFRRAATAGHTDAAYRLGNAYRLGLGVPKDPEQAISWYEIAAGRGSMEAAFTLGKIYRLGNGVRRDYGKAINWLSIAADQGFAPAEHDLGQLYQQGIGVTRDPDTARKWYSRAAARGHAPARFDLARILLDGNAQQRGLGMTYLTLAAETGYAPAQRRLASVLFNAAGVPSDPVAAFKWISLAERSWPAASRADLVREKARIAAALNPAELEQAKSLIRTWHPVRADGT